MKNILVIYYTQTGQLKKIIDNILIDLQEDELIRIDYLPIEPVKEYPFPWGKMEFFDCFPESVKGIPCKLKPINPVVNKEYDLILLGYQPWYLSPSIPVISFLKSETARKLLAGKKVVTVIGARNMWTQSQEIIKGFLTKMHAEHVGNIALTDRTNNYIAGITVIRWMVHGKKGPGFLLPEAGVALEDIHNAKKYGALLIKALNNNDFKNLQKELVANGAVRIKYHLTQIENNARKIFNIFAGYALKKAEINNYQRRKAIRLFKYYLLFVFFILSPIFSFIFIVKGIILFPLVKKEIYYFKGLYS